MRTGLQVRLKTNRFKTLVELKSIEVSIVFAYNDLLTQRYSIARAKSKINDWIIYLPLRQLLCIGHLSLGSNKFPISLCGHPSPWFPPENHTNKCICTKERDQWHRDKTVSKAHCFNPWCYSVAEAEPYCIPNDIDGNEGFTGHFFETIDSVR